MDALIVLFIVIGIVNAVTSSKNKKKKQAERRAFQQARQQTRAQAREAAGQARMSLSPEELQGHLRAMEARGKAPAPEHGAYEASAPHRDAPRPAEPQVVAPERTLRPTEPHGGEGRISTQGESEAEHAEHRLRVAAEEARQRQQREELRDLRAAERQKLRAAIVMSEILDRPVALRRPARSVARRRAGGAGF